MGYSYNRRYYAYTLTFALGSFALLLWLTLQDGGAVASSWRPLLLFTALAFVTKFLSFSMMGVVTLSMDTAIYITALLCLGTLPGAWAIFLSSYVKIVWDTLDREFLSRTEHRPFLENMSAPLFQGGTSALVALMAGELLPVQRFVEGSLLREIHVLWLALALAAFFVTLQYTVVLNKYWLRGYSWENLFRQVFLPGLGAEMILIPLAMVMALIYHNQGHVSLPLGFLIVTYIIVNFIFKKLSDARAHLHEKVKDLESLNELGRVVCSNLQATDLVPSLAQQTLSVLERADAAVIHVWNEDRRAFDIHVEMRADVPRDSFAEELANKLAHWVEQNHQAFSTGPLTTQQGTRLSRLDGETLTGGSWMGIPVEVYDQTIGVLILHGSPQVQFTAADMGLLQMIGRQAAVALQNSRLYVLATVDGLTRLFVRRYFDRRLREEVGRSQRYGTNFSLMLLDFDNFKAINDNHGHAVGDQVLRHVADVILSEVRSLDIAARYGGDEFAIILPEVNWRGGMVLASRILYRVRRERVRVDDKLLSFSLSIGMASFPEHANDSPKGIIAAADRALYEAKARGKAQAAVFGEARENEFEDDSKE